MMRNFLARTRAVALALTLALVAQPVLSTLAPTEAHATQKEVVMGVSNGGLNGWFIAGVFISIASIMACAAIVGAAEERELTLEEAWASGLIPLSCLFTTEFGDDNS